MNTTQVATRKPGIYAKNVFQLCRSFHSRQCTLTMGFNPLSVISMNLGTKPSSGLQCFPIVKSQQPLHVCLAGGQGIMENNEKDMEQFKDSQKSIYYNCKCKREEVEPSLQEDQVCGGSGSPGGSEDGSNETLQVVLATICIIFLYILFINGFELAKLARDCIKLLSGGSQSV